MRSPAELADLLDQYANDADTDGTHSWRLVSRRLREAAAALRASAQPSALDQLALIGDADISLRALGCRWTAVITTDPMGAAPLDWGATATTTSAAIEEAARAALDALNVADGREP